MSTDARRGIGSHGMLSDWELDEVEWRHGRGETYASIARGLNMKPNTLRRTMARRRQRMEREMIS